MRKRILPLAGLLAVLLAVGFLVSQLADDSSGEPNTTLLGIGGTGGESDNFEPGAPFLDNLDGDAERFAAFDTGDSASGLQTSVDGGKDSSPQSLLIDRQIIRTATLELTVEDVPGAVQRIETAAAAAGGFVASSSITIEQQPPPDDPDEEQQVRQRATVTIRVPAESYTSVMSNIRSIVDDPRDITSLTENTSEVTEEYQDLQARLRNLQATEAQYLELLALAESINDVLLVQDRLNSTRLEIEQVQGRIQLLDSLTSMATITAQVTLPPLVIELPQPEPDQSWAEEAWDNAWNASEDVLEALGVAAITGGVVLVWLIIPGALILGGWWVFTSRRKPGDQTA